MRASTRLIRWAVVGLASLLVPACGSDVGPDDTTEPQYDARLDPRVVALFGGVCQERLLRPERC